MIVSVIEQKCDEKAGLMSRFGACIGLHISKLLNFENSRYAAQTLKIMRLCTYASPATSAKQA